MADEARTKPTLDTILERINGLRDEMRDSLASLETRLNARLDKIDGMVHITRGEMMEMRGDLTEFRTEFNEFRAQFKQPA